MPETSKVTTSVPATAATPAHLHTGPGIENYHEGAKSFWKLRKNLDIALLCHTHFMCIEVIAFDPESGLEANRLYVNSVTLAQKVDQKELQDKMGQRKEAVLRQKKPFNATQVMKELLVQGMVNFILGRIQIVSCDDNGLVIDIVPQTGDAEAASREMEDLMCEPPENLTAIKCHFTKKVKSLVIDQTLYQLRTEALALKTATRKAELAVSSVDGFKKMLADKARRQEWRSKLSVPHARWIRAISRVIVQNYIAAVRQRLIDMGHPDWAAVPEDEEDETTVVQQPKPSGLPKLQINVGSHPARRRFTRRTFDNSMFTTANALESSLSATELPPISSSQMSVANVSQASMSKKDRSKLRRSLNGEILQTLGMTALNSASARSPTATPIQRNRSLDGPPPSLADSFRQVCQRAPSYTPVASLSRDLSNSHLRHLPSMVIDSH